MNARADLHRLVDDLLSDDPRTALVAYRRLTVDELPWLEQRVVALARINGWKWATIGRLLGRTRQGLQQRFRNIKLALRPDPLADRHQYEATFDRLREDARRLSDDDPIAW